MVKQFEQMKKTDEAASGHGRWRKARKSLGGLGGMLGKDEAAVLNKC
ncbi:MAG: hypothetical protein ACLR8P_08620 [Clostridium fessum]